MSSVKADIIYIGKKPIMTYVTSAIIQLATMPMITIKARGQSMGTAIDVTQIVLRKTKPAFSIADIKIGSESLVSSDGRNRDVSTIDISIKRNTP